MNGVLLTFNDLKSRPTAIDFLKRFLPGGSCLYRGERRLQLRRLLNGGNNAYQTATDPVQQLTRRAAHKLLHDRRTHFPKCSSFPPWHSFELAESTANPYILMVFLCVP